MMTVQISDKISVDDMKLLVTAINPGVDPQTSSVMAETLHTFMRGAFGAKTLSGRDVITLAANTAVNIIGSTCDTLAKACATDLGRDEQEIFRSFLDKATTTFTAALNAPRPTDRALQVDPDFDFRQHVKPQAEGGAS